MTESADEDWGTLKLAFKRLLLALPIATAGSFAVGLALRYVGIADWIVRASGISIFVLLLFPFQRTLTSREVPTRKMLVSWAVGTCFVFLVAYLFS